MDTKFLITFTCGHTRVTRFKYDSFEPQWLDAFCDECYEVRTVTEFEPQTHEAIPD